MGGGFGVGAWGWIRMGWEGRGRGGIAFVGTEVLITLEKRQMSNADVKKENALYEDRTIRLLKKRLR